MNFFESQAQARIHSRRLVVLFLLAVVLIVAAIDTVVVVALALSRQQGGRAAELPNLPTLLAQFPEAAVAATLITLLIIAGATLYKTARLRSGGGVVAKGLGASLIPAQTIDPRYRRLRNVVEEIAIASGVPVPEIYVLEQEHGINAFAAGYTPADAAITVTRGCLDKLSRDEMQGVIAHEFSHVANGDMRLSIRLMGVIFGILVISIVARSVLRASSRSRKGGGPIVLVALAIMLIGYIGVFFGRLIKASFSRQRESLADASAVQFTRQTQGLAGALKKIAGLDAGSKLKGVDGEEVSHMLFGDGTGYSRLFATHPPLVERIKQLEPGFDPQQIRGLALGWNEPDYDPEKRGVSAPVAGFAAAAPVAAPASLSGQIAHPGAAQFEHAEAVRTSLPPALKALARDPASARNLILALLLDADAALRAKQLATLRDSLGAQVVGGLVAPHAQVAALEPILRLPLAEIAFPALRQRPRSELLQLVTVISTLSHVDGQVSMFEFCLGRMIRTLVADALNPSRVAVAGSLKLKDCEIDVAHLLCALAQGGHSGEEAAREAFTVGRSHVLPQSEASYLPGYNWPAVLDPALRTLDRLDAPGKALLLDALVKTVCHDGRVTASEAELLRVVCASLHCPLPPLL